MEIKDIGTNLLSLKHYELVILYKSCESSITKSNQSQPESIPPRQRWAEQLIWYIFIYEFYPFLQSKIECYRISSYIALWCSFQWLLNWYMEFKVIFKRRQIPCPLPIESISSLLKSDPRPKRRTEKLPLLDFHHRDSKDKEFRVASLIGSIWWAPGAVKPTVGRKVSSRLRPAGPCSKRPRGLTSMTPLRRFYLPNKLIRRVGYRRTRRPSSGSLAVITTIYIVFISTEMF